MRDVIQVERADGTGEDPGSLAELARVADELLPPLVARLGVSDLGEIEVRQGSWRVRIRRAAPVPETVATAGAHPVVAGAHLSRPATPPRWRAVVTRRHPRSTPRDPHPPTTRPRSRPPWATSGSIRAWRSGHRVARGDVIGWVDVLGVRQEIVSPADGVVGRFVTEPGDPVEYGQELVAFIAATGTATDVADAGPTDPNASGSPTGAA